MEPGAFYTTVSNLPPMLLHVFESEFGIVAKGMSTGAHPLREFQHNTWLRIPTALQLIALGERIERMEKALELISKWLDMPGDTSEAELLPLLNVAKDAIQEVRRA